MKEVALAGKYKHLKCILDDGWAEMFRDGGIKLMYRDGYCSVFTGSVNKYRAEFVHHIVIDEKLTNGEFVCDHINQNKLDNRRSNLRMANRSINSLNSNVVKSNNTSGKTGVCFCERVKRWRVHLTLGKKRCYDRYFDSKNDAFLVAEFNQQIKNL